MMGCQTTKKKHRKNLGKKRREEKRREEKRREERETFLHFFSLVSLHSFFSSLSFPLSSLSLSHQLSLSLKESRRATTTTLVKQNRNEYYY